MIYLNPTRRIGERTGAIPVSEEQIERIINKLLRGRGVKRRDGLMSIVGVGVFQPQLTARDSVTSYATGKKEPLIVRLVDAGGEVAQRHSGAGGWASTKDSARGRRASKKERVARISRAIEAIGLRPTEKRLQKALARGVARRSFLDERHAAIHLTFPFNEWHDETVIRRTLANVLRHELAHSMDEYVRRKQMGRAGMRSPLEELSRDVHHVSWVLKLPKRTISKWDETIEDTMARAPRPPRREEFGADYYNRPEEVTARIPEVFAEIESKGQKVGREIDALMRYRGETRARAVEMSLLWASRTLRDLAHHGTPKTMRRVMTAIYDRFHREPWWPPATGVLKNRRTSRRRTSR